MRKKLLFVCAIALAAAFTACSNDELAGGSRQNASKGAINFSPMLNKSTRSNVVTTAPKLGSFAVSAFWAEAITTGKDVDGKKVFIAGSALAGTDTYAVGDPFSSLAKTKIVYKEGGWDYDDATQMAYWPFREKVVDKEYTGDIPLNFVAVSPAAAADVTGIDLKVAGSIPYTVPAIEDQADLCYAVSQGKVQKDGVVNLYFKHALSQMIFKAKMGTGMKVTIKSIEILNMKNSATYNLPAASVVATAEGEATQGSWTNIGNTKDNYQGFTTAAGYIAIPDSSAGNEAYSTQLTGEGQEIIFLPQEAKAGELAGNLGTAWSPNDNVAPKDAQNIVLKITCKASRGGTALIGSCIEGAANEYAVRYFPINTTWLQGKKYIYTLLFGGVSDPENPNPTGDNPGDDTPGGYDEDGNVTPPTVPISFSAQVEDWTPVHSNVSF